nr:cell division protein FtsQ/DivIB [Rhizobium sp. L1K21]
MKGNRNNGAGEGGFAGSAGRVVLPWPMRRAVRALAALASGRVTLPRYCGTVALVSFFAATGVYGMVLGGHTANTAEAVTSAAGFGLNNVKVSGNLQTSEIDILQQLGLSGSSSTLGLSVSEARSRLLGLPWVRDAEVRKVYPDTIEVKLDERTAFAIWQHGSDLSLIEENGSVIAPLHDSKFSVLPLFVGQDAETDAAEFERQISNWPEIKSRVKAFIRVSSRRWDLKLDNGVLIKLPEDNLARAMHVLSTLEDDQQLLERDIAAVDLRLEDRTTIELTPDAAERRTKAVAERAKMLKNAERNI